MRIAIRRVPRWPECLPGIAGALALWVAMAALGRIYTHFTGADLDACLFHRLTGHPCPTCGTTRGLLALARGAWREAFAWNPLMVAGMVVASMAATARLVSARSLAFACSRLERRILLGTGLILMAANWAWLLHTLP